MAASVVNNVPLRKLLSKTIELVLKISLVYHDVHFSLLTILPTVYFVSENCSAKNYAS